MDDTIITTYYLLEEFLNAVGHRDDQQLRLCTAEVMCTALLAAAFFGGNIEKARTRLWRSTDISTRRSPRDASTEGSML